MREPGEALRAAYPQALATLIRVLGDLDSAQDALHEAAARALDRWQGEVPRQPAAWLVRVARNIVVDRGRRVSVERLHRQSRASQASAQRPRREPPHPFRDDMLRLIFTCCHPSLSPDSQVALTLRTVVGLSVDEIARVYLVSNQAMEQRLTRARRALRDVPYEVPDTAELPERLDAVCAVIHVIFNDGYTLSGEVGLRRELCLLAIRLGRLLSRLFPERSEVSGLLALMLLHHARFEARQKALSLEHQDRCLYDATLIAEGRAIVERALRQRQLGPYQIQAAISAVHASAASFEATDWGELVALYRVLLRYQPTSVIRLGHAIAVAYAQSPRAGLELLLALDEPGDLAGYHLFHAAKGHLLDQCGDRTAALSAFVRAHALVTNTVERDYLASKIEKLRRHVGIDETRSS